MPDDFEVFDGKGGWGIPSDMEGLLEWMNHLIEEHNESLPTVINVLVDMVRPGTSENSHDVKPIFVGALYALGHGDIAEKFAAMYLNLMPWGLGFCISVEQGFTFESLGNVKQRAIIQAMAAVLESGGMECVVTEDNTIRVLNPDSDEHTDYTAETLIGQFRQSMEQELGPDAPGREDPTKRWIPKEEQ